MAINTFSFLLFFVIVFVLYYTNIGQRRVLWQNCILLIASYFFYGYADLKMLPLFIGITVAFYFLGLGIQKYDGNKKADWLMGCGVALGVGLLLYFKYTNFFIGAFVDLFNAVGLHCNQHTFNIVVPLGISYFVFRLLSYLIEVHRGMMAPTKDFISFATYVAFFPCMLSGPIDRPNIFIPQLEKERSFNNSVATDGLRQILWGMFKKMAVADTLAIFVDEQLTIGNIQNISGSTMILLMMAYTFQLYADFSGYSDMAIGVGKLLNIRVAMNFKYPLFALNVADFWRRWHISLTSWMTDYIYFPLSFILRSMKKWGLIIAALVNFIIVGMWHGAGWLYIIYGAYYGVLFAPLIYFGRIDKDLEIQTNRIGLPKIKYVLRMLLTFILVNIGMMLFRSPDITSFFETMSRIGNNLFAMPEPGSLTAWLLVICMLLVEWIQRKREYGLELSGVKSRFVRWSCYLVLMFCIFALGGGEQHFIYQVF